MQKKKYLLINALSVAVVTVILKFNVADAQSTTNCERAKQQQQQALSRVYSQNKSPSPAKERWYAEQQKQIEKNYQECQLQAQKPALDKSNQSLVGRASETVGIGSAEEYPKPKFVTKPKPVGPMTGQVKYRDVTLSVAVGEGHFVGDLMEGPVTITAGPKRYIYAKGKIISANRHRIDALQRTDGSWVRPTGGIMVRMKPLNRSK